MKIGYHRGFALLLALCLSVALFSACGNSSKGQSMSAGNSGNQFGYGFVDYTMFSEFWTDGMFRCGSDFAAGDYYILSLYGAAAYDNVADSPNGFLPETGYRVLRKITVTEGQYVKLNLGVLMITSAEFERRDLKEYGIFLVGKDLLAGDYKITSITNECSIGQYQISGIVGTYQISNDSPDNEPEYCSPLYDAQTYISVQNGQYLIINNASLMMPDGSGWVPLEAVTPAKNVMILINRIGEVTIDSKPDIDAAMDAYNLLDENSRNEVENIEILYAAQEAFEKILPEYIQAKVQEYTANDNIDFDELKNFVSEYFSYLDDEQRDDIGCVIGQCKILDLVVQEVKKGMKNPNSFELADFDPGYVLGYGDGTYSSLIKITYRGTNSFGGVVPDTKSGLIRFRVNFNDCSLEFVSGYLM